MTEQNKFAESIKSNIKLCSAKFSEIQNKIVETTDNYNERIAELVEEGKAKVKQLNSQSDQIVGEYIGYCKSYIGVTQNKSLDEITQDEVNALISEISEEQKAELSELEVATTEPVFEEDTCKCENCTCEQLNVIEFPKQDEVNEGTEEKIPEEVNDEDLAELHQSESTLTPEEMSALQRELHSLDKSDTVKKVNEADIPDYLKPEYNK